MRLPNFGLVAGIVILLLLFPTFLFFHAAWHPHPLRGVYVRLPNIYAERDASSPPLLVRLDRQKRFHLYDGRIPVEDTPPLSANELEGKLRQALAERPSHYVYLNADPELTWQDGLDAIDLIRKAGGEPLFFTPRLRSPSAD
jgi:biopolymer transport protein ExbD